jgi:hypothetical protein
VLLILVKSKASYAKKLIIKTLFQYGTFFLQSSKVVYFLEMGKKSCLSEKIYEKNVQPNAFCPYFCPVKNRCFG